MEALLGLLTSSTGLSQILALAEAIPQISTLVSKGMPVITEIQRLYPVVAPILKQLGAQFFPTVPVAAQADAAAVLLAKQNTMAIQTKLNKLGATLTVDGSYGKMTKAAVTKAQTDLGVTPVDGWAGPITMKAVDAKLATV